MIFLHPKLMVKDLMVPFVMKSMMFEKVQQRKRKLGTFNLLK